MSGNTLAMGRYQDDIIQNVFVTVVNFGDAPETIDIAGAFHPDLTTALVLIDSQGNAG